MANLANLIVLLIMLGCGAAQFLKGTAIKAFAMMVAAVSASFLSFGYFEIAAGYLAKYVSSIAEWTQTIGFVMIFLFSFAVFLVLIIQVLKETVELDPLPEKIVSAVCGLILGFIISGVILTAATLAPLPGKYPYERFSVRNPKPDQPNKLLLNADGFVAGMFGMVSKGSLSALGDKQSFAVLHASFIDQLYLNRHSKSQGAVLLTEEPAIEVAKRNGYWFPVNNIQDSDGGSISPPAGYKLALVRVGINKSSLREAGKFSLSQLRIVCTPKNTEKPLAGKGTAVYPIGYMTGANRLQKKGLHEVIELTSGGGGGNEILIDFGFFVPSDMECSLVQYKQNNIAELGSPAKEEEIPNITPFGSSSPAQTGRGRGRESSYWSA